MASDAEIERLISEITERVVAQLEPARGSSGEGRALRILALFPVASAGLGLVAGQLARLVGGGGRVKVLCGRELLADIENGGLRGRLGGDIGLFEESNLSALLSEIESYGLVLVGSMGFEHARALCEMRDRQPFVRLVSQALLRGCRVALVADDLRASGTGARGRPADEANSLLRELERLRIIPVEAKSLTGLVRSIETSAATLARSFDGLVTEEDIGRLAREGESRISLPAGTIVTPLAASRARELGIEIIKLAK